MSDFTPENLSPGATKSKPPKNIQSVGEAEVKVGNWFIMLFAIFGVEYYDFEREAMYKAMGPVVRRFPILRDDSKLTKGK